MIRKLGVAFLFLALTLTNLTFFLPRASAWTGDLPRCQNYSSGWLDALRADPRFTSATGWVAFQRAWSGPPFNGMSALAVTWDAQADAAPNSAAQIWVVDDHGQYFLQIPHTANLYIVPDTPGSPLVQTSAGDGAWTSIGLFDVTCVQDAHQVQYMNWTASRFPDVTATGTGPAATISPAAGPPDTLFDVGWACPQAAEGTVRVVDANGRALGADSDLAMSIMGPQPGLISRHQYFHLPHEGNYIAIPTCAGVDLAGLAFTVKVTASHAALGDSFSSGEGATSFMSGTGFPSDGGDHSPTENQCHRSETAWAFGVGQAHNDSTRLDACSGALISDFTAYNAKNFGEVPQLDNISPTTTKLVTLTLGGNDIGFVDILKRCVLGDLNPYSRANCGQYPFEGDAPYATTIEGKITQLGTGVPAKPATATTPATSAIPSLHEVYQQIGERIGGGGTIIVAGYPRFFGDQMNDKIVNPYTARPLPAHGGKAPEANFPVCRVGGASATSTTGLYIVPDDVTWLNNVATALNKAIRDEVTRAQRELAKVGRSDVRIVFADVDAGFNDHRLCDTNTAWLNGVTISGAALGPLQTSMHPNEEGQKAYTRTILKNLT